MDLDSPELFLIVMLGLPILGIAFVIYYNRSRKGRAAWEELRREDESKREVEAFEQALEEEAARQRRRNVEELAEAGLHSLHKTLTKPTSAAEGLQWFGRVVRWISTLLAIFLFGAGLWYGNIILGALIAFTIFIIGNGIGWAAQVFAERHSH